MPLFPIPRDTPGSIPFLVYTAAMTAAPQIYIDDSMNGTVHNGNPCISGRVFIAPEVIKPFDES